MAVFDIRIDDLWGNELAAPTQYLIGEASDPTRVEIGINEPRTGNVSLSLYDAAVQHLSVVRTVTIGAVSEDYLIGALIRMLRIYWRGHLVFRGLVHAPLWRAKSGYVAVHAMDMWLRLQHHNLRYGDDVVGTVADPKTTIDDSDNLVLGVPADYRTIRSIVKAARNTDAQAASGLYPDIGIAIGAHEPKATVVGDQVWPASGPATLNVDSTANFASSGKLNDPSAGLYDIDRTLAYTGITATSFTGVTGYTPGATIHDGDAVTDFVTNADIIQIDRGTICADQILDIVDMAVGPDVELEPVDSYGATPSGSPYYCKVNTYTQQGSDRSADVVFVYDDTDELASNLDDCEWEPDGTTVRNYSVQVGQGTDTDPGPRAIYHNLEAWKDIGIWEDWQNPSSASGKELPEPVLLGLAEADVQQYSRPPNQITLTCLLDPATGDPLGPRYIDDFVVGDYVRVICRKGYMVLDLVVRIMKVTLQQADAAGNVQPILEVVPKVSTPLELAGGVDDDG